jgi:hypothetical protein
MYLKMGENIPGKKINSHMLPINLQCENDNKIRLKL